MYSLTRDLGYLSGILSTSTHALTCQVKRGVPADYTDPSLRVGSIAVVDTNVRLAVLVVYYPEKEQLSGREKHAVRFWVFVGRDDRMTVAIPCYNGRRVTLCLTVQSRWLILRYILIFWVFDYSWIRYLLNTC